MFRRHSHGRAGAAAIGHVIVDSKGTLEHRLPIVGGVAHGGAAEDRHLGGADLNGRNSDSGMRKVLRRELLMRGRKGGHGSPARTKRDDVVAKRTFELRNGRRLIAKIHRPYRIRTREWAAPFTVTGLPGEYRSRALGADGLQALLLAAQALRSWLERSGMKFSWLGGEVGHTGIPRTIADVFGLAFSRHAEELVTRESTAHVRRVMAARRRAAKRAGVGRSVSKAK